MEGGWGTEEDLAKSGSSCSPWLPGNSWASPPLNPGSAWLYPTQAAVDRSYEKSYGGRAGRGYTNEDHSGQRGVLGDALSTTGAPRKFKSQSPGLHVGTVLVHPSRRRVWTQGRLCSFHLPIPHPREVLQQMQGHSSHTTNILIPPPPFSFPSFCWFFCF